MVSLPENIAQLLTQQASRYSEQVALHYRGQAISYQALLSASQQLAQRLMDAGVQSGDRVAIYLPKQPETVAGIFGSSFAAAVFVPVNPQLKAQQVTHIIQDSGAKCLLTSKQRWQ